MNLNIYFLTSSAMQKMLLMTITLKKESLPLGLSTMRQEKEWK